MIIHCDTTRYIFEVIEKQEYKFLFEDLIVLDVGCNIGTFSLWLQKQAKQIYAVDCDEKVTTLFRKSVRDNGFENIKVYTSKIGGVESTVTETIKGFMEGCGIKYVDVLKLDVEGDELEIINALDFPADKITTIIGELHYQDERRELFKNRLIALGYRYTELLNGHFIARR